MSFQIDKIQDNLVGVVGFRQPTATDYNIVDATNLATSSGLLFQSVSKYVTIKNIKDCQEDRSISDVNFNTYLTNMVRDAATQIMHSIFAERDVMENNILYDGVYDRDLLAANDTSFVGFEINMANEKTLTTLINSVTLDFNANETVKLLLFNSNQNALINSESITVVGKQSTEKVLNWVLPFVNSIKGGRWYIGYLNSGLTAQAYNRDDARNYFHCIGINPVKITGWNTETMFDQSVVEYDSYNNGLNFDIATMRDWTSVIVQNKIRFAQAISLQVGVGVIETMIATTRSNATQRANIGSLQLELNGNYGEIENLSKSYGLVNKLKYEIRRLREFFVEQPLIERGTLS